jgi:hypothetical protein
MNCTCGTQTVFHQYQNFSYHFCPKCQIEVKDFPQSTPTQLNWQSLLKESLNKRPAKSSREICVFPDLSGSIPMGKEERNGLHDFLQFLREI